MGSTLRVFIDTEFTDFINTDLISIGLAASDPGYVFYGENLEYNQGWASPWVNAHVVPLLKPAEYGLKFNELSARVWAWLDELPCTSVIIVVDYRTDYELLYDLFGNEMHPKVIGWENLYTTMQDHGHLQAGEGGPYHQVEQGDANAQRIKNDFQQEFLDWFKRWGRTQHHAGADALANRDAYMYVAHKYGLPI